MGASSGHLKHVDGLRALAALYVLVHHAYLTIWPSLSSGASGIDAIFTNWAFFGHFGVAVFIVISGYVLALPYCDGTRAFEALTFYGRRAKRILPAYYASIGLCLVLIYTVIGAKTGTHWDFSIPVTSAGLWEHLLLVPNVFGSSEINHVLWSIGVEWQIYMIFPLLYLLWRRAGSSWTLAVGVVVGYALYFALRKTSYAGTTPQFLGLFCMGMFAANPPKLKSMPWGTLALLFTASIILVCQKVPAVSVMARFPTLDSVVGLATMCLLIRSEEDGAARRALEWKPLVWIGTFSYSVYLMHAPLLQIVWQLVPATHESTTLALLTLLGISIAPILAASYLFFRLFERPLMSKRQKAAIEEHAAP